MDKKNISLRIKSNFRDNKTWFIIVCVLEFFGLPFFSLFSCVISAFIIEKRNYGSIEEFKVLRSISMVLFALAVFAGIIVFLNIFSYLRNKSQADMIVSLPLNSHERFFSDFLSGMIITMLPYIVASVLSALILMVGYSKYDMAESIGMNKKTALFLLFSIFLIMFMLYVMMVLACACCGSFRGVCVYFVALNIVPVFFTLSIGYFICCNVIPFQGSFFPIDNSYYIMNYMDISGPIGGLIHFKRLLDENFVSKLLNTQYAMTMWAIKYFIVAVVILIMAYLGYIKRKSEDSGQKYICRKMLYYVVSTMFISSVMLCGIMTGSIIIVCIVGMVICVVFNVFRENGEIAKLVHYVITTLCVFVVSAIVKNNFNKNGPVLYLPECENIVSYSICTEGAYIYTESETISGVLNDKELYGIYKDIMSRKPELYENENTSDITVPMAIAVMDKTGNVNMLRRYVSFENQDDYVKKVLNTDSYKKSVSEEIKKQASVLYSKDKEYSTTKNNIIIRTHDNNTNKTYFLDEDTAYKLVDCYIKDISDMTDERIFKILKEKDKTLSYEMVLNGQDGMTYIVNEYFINTMDFLKKNDIIE